MTMKKKKKNSNELKAFYVRNIVFGIEDSLVSTVGFLSGVNISTTDRNILIITGIILIFVEAFSMGVGSFLSEDASYAVFKKKFLTLPRIIGGGFLMFISYFLTGFIPLSPYLFLEGQSAFTFSVLVSLLTLLFLGFSNAHISHKRYISQGLKMMLIGGFAILLGMIVGFYLQKLI